MFTREYNKNDPDDWIPVNQTFDDDSYDEWLGHQMHTRSEIYPHIREAVETKRDHEAKRFNGKRKQNFPPLKIGDQIAGSTLKGTTLVQRVLIALSVHGSLPTCAPRAHSMKSATASIKRYFGIAAISN